MAFPTLRAVSQGAISTAALNVTITLPTGHAEGDLLIIGLSLDGNRTVSAPSGWQLLANPTNHTTCRFPIWYKTRASSESNPQLTWVTTSEEGTWFAFAFTTGTWSGTPEIATTFGTSTNPNAPSLAPSWGANETTWLAFHGWDYNRTSSTNPSNYTNRTYQAGSSTGSAGHRTHSRNYQMSSDDPSQITISASDEWYAHTVAVKPYVETMSGTPQPVGSVNIGGVWKTISKIQVNIGGVWKDATDVKVNVGGVWKSAFSGGTPSQATSWNYLGTSGTYNGTTSYAAAGSCDTYTTVQTWLTNNFAPTGYQVGYKMRVQTYDDQFAFCGNMFFEAT